VSHSSNDGRTHDPERDADQPPAPDSAMATNRNCDRMSPCRAPIASRMTIS
jgi:hypothetical protein